MLAFRSLDPFRPLREPDRRRRNEERLSRSEQRTGTKPKIRLDRKSPIQVRIRLSPAERVCELLVPKAAEPLTPTRSPGCYRPCRSPSPRGELDDRGLGRSVGDVGNPEPLLCPNSLEDRRVSNPLQAQLTVSPPSTISSVPVMYLAMCSSSLAVSCSP